MSVAGDCGATVRTLGNIAVGSSCVEGWRRKSVKGCTDMVELLAGVDPKEDVPEATCL